jgi:restriction endonuclease S subunit
MNSLDDYKRSVIWHVVTGKYEVLPDLTLRKRRTEEMREKRGISIPTNWDVISLKDVASLKNGDAHNEEDWESEGIPIVRIQNLNEGDTRFNYWGGSLEKKTVAKTGDILLAWAGSIRAQIWDGPTAIVNQHIFLIETGEDKKWLTESINLELEELAKTPRGGAGLIHLSKGTCEKVRLATPKDKKEKERIVRFLERFASSLPNPAPVIETTTAWKKSLIWHVVTGKYEVLDNGQLRKREAGGMKESGMSYLGRIPKNWTTAPLKQWVRIEKGENPDQKWEGEYPYFNGGTKATGNCAAYNIDGITLLISNGGASAGAVTKVLGKAWAGGDCYIAKYPEWLEGYLLWLSEVKELYTKGSAIPHADKQKLEAMQIPIPPMEERVKLWIGLRWINDDIREELGVL